MGVPNFIGDGNCTFIRAVPYGFEAKQYTPEQRGDVVVIDWEQCGASPFFLAPEGNGLWDVEVAANTETGEVLGAKPGSATMAYHKFTGPLPDDCGSWPRRNVFPLWQRECPRALEAVEVYSVRVIFEQSDNIYKREQPEAKAVVWTHRSGSVPEWDRLPLSQSASLPIVTLDSLDPFGHFGLARVEMVNDGVRAGMNRSRLFFATVAHVDGVDTSSTSDSGLKYTNNTNTMALFLPPSVDHFNSLPDIVESNGAFQNYCTPKMLSDICAVCLKHQAQHIYGLALVHQHFDLEADEKLVSIGNVAVPLKTDFFLTPIAATRWAFSRKGIIPYEFSTEARQVDMSQHYDFVHELGKLIHSCGLSDNLVLCLLDSIADTTKGPTTEFTSDRANITLPFDIGPEDRQSVEAAWQALAGSLMWLRALPANNIAPDRAQ
ncbi:serine threonine kinase, variant 1 [Trichoderma arundinaceum]|uniref:Serine threonine kinase, variant 1 n=1 Tax=Trichoderma arundinaceum TaxID=490622 RepID=A0A395NG70_TRIAR|nr:serine threonine kinase, variant 1 [Trichoderma arundinaceum]